MCWETNQPRGSTGAAAVMELTRTDSCLTFFFSLFPSAPRAPRDRSRSLPEGHQAPQLAERCLCGVQRPPFTGESPMEPGLPGGTAPTALGVSNSAQTVKKSVPLVPKSYLFTDTSDVVMTLLYTGSLLSRQSQGRDIL